MKFLKQSTSTVIAFGPGLLPSDGVTLVTTLVSALDHATTGIFLCKNGAAAAIRHATVTATTYDAYGSYLVTLDTTDTGTVGRLRVMFAAAASTLPIWEDFTVLSANVYDSLIGATANLQVDAIKVGGTTQTARDLGASVLLSTGTGTGQLDFTSGVVKTNLVQILGTAAATPATAGILDVNAKNINNVAATSVTTINANVGTTQPVNFTGTGASALAKGDMVDIAGAAVSTSTAQIGVNAVNHGGTAQTGRDIGASVLLSPGTGTGQLSITAGIASVNATQFAGQTITAAAGVTLPTSVASPTNITAGTITTTTNLTNAPTAGDFTAVMKTSITTAATAATPTPVADPNVALIKAKTDNLPAAPAAVSDIPTAAANADKLLGRNLAGGSDGGRMTKDALRVLRNKVTVVGTALTVMAEDDSTTAWSGVVATDAAALPIVTVDPA